MGPQSHKRKIVVITHNSTVKELKNIITLNIKNVLMVYIPIK
jgi:hypothetical protein